MTPEIRQVPYDHPDARLLVERVQEYYLRIYGGRDDDPTEAAMFTPPSGAFFVGYVDGVPVTTGAWRGAGVPALGTTRTAELKRMYVAGFYGTREFADVAITFLGKPLPSSTVTALAAPAGGTA